MELMDRILRLIRANVNSLVNSAEDPEKILEKAVMEMQFNLVQLRQAVATAIACGKRTQRQAALAESTAEEWYRRAQLALVGNNEFLAREALIKRRVYQETARVLCSQIEEQNYVVIKLKKDMRTLEMKISEAKTKKDMYIARARSASAALRVQELLGGVSRLNNLSAFERMEEKILHLEAKSEIAGLGRNESTDDIGTELAAMKGQLPKNPN